MGESAEKERLNEAREKSIPWKKWGPYLSERQWGTVREDYSTDGNAWDYFSHDQARSRAYRWGEDGIAGISDDKQRLCFSLALWNGKDPILKERLFGLTNSEGNHGEDVKEYYFYLDSTPTHSRMKYLYKYPQAAYPYDALVSTNKGRSRNETEYELLDTGVFDEDRYFDIFVEYAKESPKDILMKISAFNRGPEPATLYILPTLWFRNTWSWPGGGSKPVLQMIERAGCSAVHAHNTDPLQELPEDYYLYCEGEVPLLFTENETNNERIFGTPNASPYVKDGINNFVVHGQQKAVNPERIGTKVSACYKFDTGAGKVSTIRLRLTVNAPNELLDPFRNFDEVFAARLNEADEFYATVIPSLDADASNIMRQAIAGMLWSKQYYYYDVDKWLTEHGADPFNPKRRAPRNEHWHHMYNSDILSMPDKWEYPWYAAWDMAFHVLALTLVDEDFGKQQLDLMLRENYIHPNGQIPAYEWNFEDVNPPVHAWSTFFTYSLEKLRRGQGDIDWLEQQFHKLSLNFTWWVNRKDRSGSNVFEGGFLGLDNIGVFDRSSSLPTGGYLEQADGTAWMALFCQNMIEISAELAMVKPAYIHMLVKFIEHFLWIASSMLFSGMWDEEDGFFYDILRLPDGRSQRLKVRSIVGLLPLCAVTVFEGDFRRKHPEKIRHLQSFIAARPDMIAFIHDPAKDGCAGRRMAAILNETNLRRVLAKMLDEKEFLSPYGIRSLSHYHAENPFVFTANGREFRVPYLPAESDSGMFGGNSNWRGPIWMPVNSLIIRALLQYYSYYGNDFMIECPTGSGRHMNLYQVAEEIMQRLSGIFLRGSDGCRPVYGENRKFQDNPHWRDNILFYEYFHGDNGSGLGASHQTGWTGIIARLMHLFATSTAEQVLEIGKRAGITEIQSGKVS
jgi:hypothetical protein